MSTKALYRVTASSVDTVAVDSFIVDRDFGRIYTWNLWDSKTGDFKTGWTGVRLQRLCVECFNLPTPKATEKGHDGTHEDAPRVQPEKVPA